MRPVAGFLCLLALACGSVGCASMGLGKAFTKNQQWEPPVDEEEGIPKAPRSAPSALRSSKDQESNENFIDKLMWSDTSREISRNLGGSL